MLSIGCSFYQGTAPMWALYELQLFSGHSYLLCCGVLQGLQVKIPCVMLLHGLQVDCFTVFFFMGCRGISVQVCEERSLLLLLWSQCLQECFPDIFSLISPSCCIPGFNISEICYHQHHWWFQLWATVRIGWNWFCPTWRQTLISSHRGCLYIGPLLHKPSTIFLRVIKKKWKKLKVLTNSIRIFAK